METIRVEMFGDLDVGRQSSHSVLVGLDFSRVADDEGFIGLHVEESKKLRKALKRAEREIESE